MSELQPYSTLIKLMQRAWYDVHRIQTWVDYDLADGYRLDDSSKYLLVCSAQAIESQAWCSLNGAELDAALRAEDSSAPWDSAEERTFRFLQRSYGRTKAFHDFYRGLLKGLQVEGRDFGYLEGYISADSARSLTLMISPPSERWGCKDHPTICTATDHKHSLPDPHCHYGLVWPTQNNNFDSKLPPATIPMITCRDFSIRSIMVECDETKNLQSAISATERALQVTYNDLSRLDVPSEWDEADWDTRQLHRSFWGNQRGMVSGLARIACTVQSALKRLDTMYTLGVILHDGVQILWPDRFASDRENANTKPILIKAYKITQSNMWKYAWHELKFEPVRRMADHERSEIVQTKAFMDLPAEIRNSIYRLVLEDWAYNKSRSIVDVKQPALSCTCRTVNKEFMSLMLQKYGWFVSM